MEPMQQKHFSDVQIAIALGVRPTSVRRWRVKNKAAGYIKYGPPYEYRGSNVVYPIAAFRKWCAEVRVDGGVIHCNLPPGAPVAGTPALAALEQ